MRRSIGGAIIVLLICIVAVPGTACLLGHARWTGDIQPFRPHLIAGALLGVSHLVLRPILRLITMPLGCLTLGLSGTLIDVGLIYLSVAFVDGFAVPNFLYALVTALIINAANWIIRGK